MASVTVLQFSARDVQTGEPIWPPQIETTISVPGTVSTSPGITYISISADANCRLSINGTPSVSSTPILSAVQNDFIIASAGVEALSFIAEA